MRAFFNTFILTLLIASTLTQFYPDHRKFRYRDAVAEKKRLQELGRRIIRMNRRSRRTDARPNSHEEHKVEKKDLDLKRDESPLVIERNKYNPPPPPPSSSPANEQSKPTENKPKRGSVWQNTSKRIKSRIKKMLQKKRDSKEEEKLNEMAKEKLNAIIAQIAQEFQILKNSLLEEAKNASPENAEEVVKRLKERLQKENELMADRIQKETKTITEEINQNKTEVKDQINQEKKQIEQNMPDLNNLGEMKEKAQQVMSLAQELNAKRVQNSQKLSLCVYANKDNFEGLEELSHLGSSRDVDPTENLRETKSFCGEAQELLPFEAEKCYSTLLGFYTDGIALMKEINSRSEEEAAESLALDQQKEFSELLKRTNKDIASNCESGEENGLESPCESYSNSRFEEMRHDFDLLAEKSENVSQEHLGYYLKRVGGFLRGDNMDKFVLICSIPYKDLENVREQIMKKTEPAKSETEEP